MLAKAKTTLVALACLGALAACGNDEPEAGTGNGAGTDATGTVPAASVGATGNRDVESGCWTEDQRVEDLGFRQWSAPPAMVVDAAKKYTATVDTTLGQFQAELFPAEAPQTVNNFVCLVRAGYMDGIQFHRVVPAFVIQGGDPTATGREGPGYRFADEPIVRDYAPGTLAMANSGADTNGSQFFVVLEGGQIKLAKSYTIFGRVTVGMDVVEAIGITDPRADPVFMESVTITEA